MYTENRRQLMRLSQAQGARAVVLYDAYKCVVFKTVLVSLAGTATFQRRFARVQLDRVLPCFNGLESWSKNAQVRKDKGCYLQGHMTDNCC